VPASVAAQLADAVVTELNDQVLSGVTATRSWLPRAELKDLDQARVTVAPRSLARRRESRAEASRQAVVDAAVQQQVGPSGEDLIDELVGLAEQIAEHFDGWACAAPMAVCTAAEHKVLAAPEHLDQHHVLTSVVGLTFWLP